jgi:hypothetical protein
MRSPALALGWELWARNRRGLIAVIAVFAIQVVAMMALEPFDGTPGRYFLVSKWLMWCNLAAYLYLLSVFVHADLVPGGRSQGLPPRLFALPVRTRWLVGAPMLYGAATVFVLALVYFASANVYSLVKFGLLAYLRTLPWEVILFLIAFLAWAQALSWTLVRSPLARLVLIVIGLPSAGLAAAALPHIVRATFNLPPHERYMNGVFAALSVCAYAFAVIGVGFDRRGDRFTWGNLGRWVRRILPARPARRGGNFTSPAAAQRWVEVRRHAWMLPLVMVSFFVVLLWSALLPFSRADVARALVAAVVAPAVAGFFVGFGMGKSNFWARDLHLAPLTALRPMSCQELARAKLQAAAISTLLTWGVVLVLAPAGLLLSGYTAVAHHLLTAWFGGLSVWQLVILIPTGLVGVVGFTWLQIVGGMCLSLTGRTAVVNGAVVLYAALAALFVGLGVWLGSDPDARNAVQVILGGVGLLILLLKLAALIGTRKWYETHPDRVLPRLALIWSVVAVCLIVAIEIGLPEGPIPARLVALYAVLLLPFSRLLAVPAAVAWNRHR